MNFQEIFKYFINSIFPILILIIGMTGNILGLIVLKSKKLKNIGPILIYKFLFISDSIYLPQIIIAYMGTGFNYDPTVLSSLSCKIYNYFNYAFDAFSPWLLVYISIEKFISISYPSKRFILRKKRNESLYFFVTFVFALIYYIPQAFCWDIIDVSNTNNETSIFQCGYINFELQQISSYMDAIHRLILPFILLTIFSALLIGSIFRSRRRVSDSVNENSQQLKRDVRFAICTFSMNLLFMALNLPLSIIQFLPSYSILSWSLTFYLFYLSYGTNFYVLLITNSIFRKEVFELFSKKAIQTNINQGTIRNAKITVYASKETLPNVLYKNEQVIIQNDCIRI